MSNRLVFISGIGADRRAFNNLHTADQFEHIYAEWIPLKAKRESFDSYCNRMIDTYQIVPDDVLVGLSFGGFVAQKIAKDAGNRRVVLISSFRNKSDLTPLMRQGLYLKLYKLLPPFRIPIISDLVAFFLNSGKRESQIVIKEMLKVADFQFINWAIRQIDQVDLGGSYSADFLSFTGGNDKLVSNWGDPENQIKSGSHFMVFDNAEFISEKLNQYLRST